MSNISDTIVWSEGNVKMNTLHSALLSRISRVQPGYLRQMQRQSVMHCDRLQCRASWHLTSSEVPVCAKVGKTCKHIIFDKKVRVEELIALERRKGTPLVHFPFEQGPHSFSTAHLHSLVKHFWVTSGSSPLSWGPHSTQGNSPARYSTFLNRINKTQSCSC